MLIVPAGYSLVAVLDDAVDTNELPIYVAFQKEAVNTQQGSRQTVDDAQSSLSTGATEVTILTEVETGYVKKVTYLSVHNKDTASRTITIKLTDGTTDIELFKIAVAIDKTLIYSGGRWTRNDQDVDGALTFGGNITTEGDLAAGGTLTVDGDANLTAAATVSGLLTAGSASVGGNVTVEGDLIGATATGITAFATGGQESATQLTKDNNKITTCATNGDSVKLPAATAGRRIFVKNAGVATLAIFPASGEAINALSADASISLATVKSMLFVCVVDGTWDTMLTA